MSVEGRYTFVRNVLSAQRLHTVCESAACPNECECFNRGTATFMILGGACSRDCRFCAVGTGRPDLPDADEPRRVAEAAVQLGLRHVVVTSVTRDDLPDGGADLFVATIESIRSAAPGRMSVEVLTPDFLGRPNLVERVLSARPDVYNHNLETVRRLQPEIRPAADYERSLFVLQTAARHRPKLAVKSGLMLGLGESDAELEEAMADLRGAGCDILTLGQYLAPSRAHWPVARFVPPPMFQRHAETARALGFKAVAAGPLVRSSYGAEDCLLQYRLACSVSAEQTDCGHGDS